MSARLFVFERSFVNKCLSVCAEMVMVRIFANTVFMYDDSVKWHILCNFVPNFMALQK